MLTVSNTKTMKGEGKGYRTFILHLAPSTVSGYNTCPMASKGCAAACLNTAGRGIYANIQNARIRKTRRFFEDRKTFMLDLAAAIATAVRRSRKAGLEPVIRLNGTSDIRWETIPVAGFPNVMAMFPDVTFYDYTKIPNRRNLPPNYKLTFSRSEDNEDKAPAGMNMAVVFGVAKSKALPLFYKGRPVVDGDTDDLRFLDPAGVIVGLRGKGKASVHKANDHNGFVVTVGP